MPLDPDMVSVGGSGLAGGLDLARRTLVSSPQGGDRAVVVFTDGEAFDGPGPLESAGRALRRAGVTVVAVPVGDIRGARIPEADGDWHRDAAGNVVITTRRDDLLQAMAQAAERRLRSRQRARPGRRRSPGARPPQSRAARPIAWPPTCAARVDLRLIAAAPPAGPHADAPERRARGARAGCRRGNRAARSGPRPGIASSPAVTRRARGRHLPPTQGDARAIPAGSMPGHRHCSPAIFATADRQLQRATLSLDPACASVRSTISARRTSAGPARHRPARHPADRGRERNCSRRCSSRRTTATRSSTSSWRAGCARRPSRRRARGKGRQGERPAAAAAAERCAERHDASRGRSGAERDGAGRTRHASAPEQRIAARRTAAGAGLVIALALLAALDAAGHQHRALAAGARDARSVSAAARRAAVDHRPVFPRHRLGRRAGRAGHGGVVPAPTARRLRRRSRRSRRRRSAGSGARATSSCRFWPRPAWSGIRRTTSIVIVPDDLPARLRPDRRPARRPHL